MAHSGVIPRVQEASIFDESTLGRFDQSFIVKLIKDFFLLLLIVGTIEMGARFALTYYDFSVAGENRTRLAAERLASNVRDIMVNSGGPVAAHTLYPILKNSHEARGFEIAIEPSKATIQSIKKIFGFTPNGIQPHWSEGIHHSFTTVIKADEFCLRCHTLAKIGEPLGSVTVRSYLANSLDAWWREVRLSGMVSLFKIVLDTTLLFFLVRARLEPVLSLKSVVSGLARATADLSLRAPVRSGDEFGELASDLNRFLDRLNQILDDLGAVLARVAALNQRLETIQGQMADGFQKIGDRLAVATRHAFKGVGQEPLLSAQWLGSLQTTRELALHGLADTPEKRVIGQGLAELFDQLELAAKKSQQLFKGADATGSSLIALSEEVRNFSHFMGEMVILEEKMQAIAETGQNLVDRLIARDD